jgi:hypothetical protein
MVTMVTTTTNVGDIDKGKAMVTMVTRRDDDNNYRDKDEEEGRW